MHKSLMVIFFGLLGSMAGEQVSAQVSVSPSPGAGSAQVIPIASAGVSSHGGVTTFTVQPKPAQAGAAIDFVNAKSLELPAVAPRSELQAHYDLMDALQARPALGGGGFSPGAEGHGHASPVNLGLPMGAAAGPDEVTPQEFGTTEHPFSAARADLPGLTTSNAYPYRASGKLSFSIGGKFYLCSASLIKRGVVVTAAHCVANFGTNQFYSNWKFVPAYSNGIAPYGVWSVKSAMVMTSYFNGTGSCAVPGIVCRDDVALLVLNPSPAGAYPGTATGWYGWGYDGYGFTGGGLAQITQIGYPVCLDNGVLMQRNDSFGYTSSANSNNTIIGTLMCGGSSGGPWLVNFGVRPALTATTPGIPADPNIVVGVTSWGFEDTLPKEGGAAPFTSGNIVPLVNASCTQTPAACN
jgi:V8-like Glu-specific endopeptidase